MPRKGSLGAAAYDLRAIRSIHLKPWKTVQINLGFAISFPKHLYWQISGRSSLTKKQLLVPLGTLDADYQGEVKVQMLNANNSACTIRKGQRIAQLSIKQQIPISWQQVSSFPTTTGRGVGAFGSTGRF